MATGETLPKPEESKKQEDIIIDNILSKSGTDLKSILGPSPLNKFSQKPAKRIYRFNPGWSWVKFSLLVGFFVFLYFYIQLQLTNPWLNNIFGDNYTVKADQSEQIVIKTQTGINKNNYLIAKFYLDKFVYLADLHNYQYNQLSSTLATPSLKQSTQIQLDDLAKQISETLKVVKTQLNKKLWPAPKADKELNEVDLLQIYKTALTNQIQTDKQTLLTDMASQDPETISELRKEIQNLETVLVLSYNPALTIALKNVDLENLTHQDINSILLTTNQIIKNDFSIISKIKEDRIFWSKIINNIIRITKNVDALYGHAALGNLQEIRYTSFSFEAESGKIIVSGETTRDDAKNFTVLANLMDALEQSPEFKNVEGRTFTKNKPGSSGESTVSIIAPIRLTFLIQPEGEVDPRDKKDSLDEEEKNIDSQTTSTPPTNITE